MKKINTKRVFIALLIAIMLCTVPTVVCMAASALEKGVEPAYCLIHSETAYYNGFCSDCEGTQAYQPAILNDNKTHDDLTDDYYEIGNAGQLYWFANFVNTYITEGEGDSALKTYPNLNVNAVLTKNIVVNTEVLKADGTLADDTSLFKEWTPIGTKDALYSGLFDGCGHTISGLYFEDETVNHVGLFGGSSGIIKSISVLDSYLFGKYDVGSIVGWAENASIINCHNNGFVKANNNNAGGLVGVGNSMWIYGSSNSGTIIGMDGEVGGIVGHAEGITLQNCFNTATIYATNIYAGGLIGSALGGTVLENCYNAGEIAQARNCVGGLIGELQNEASIIKCYNIADITVNHNETGGLIGNIYGNVTMIVKDCYNTGDVKQSESTIGENRTAIGGLFGYLRGQVNVINCHNEGDILGYYRYIGGFFGRAEDNITITGGYNSGTVVGQVQYDGDGAISSDTHYIGGIGGHAYENVRIENVENRGNVTGRYCIGGIMGDTKASVEIIGCTNKATITASGDSVGGIVGKGEATSVKNCINTGKITNTVVNTNTVAKLGGILGQAINLTVVNCHNSGELVAWGDQVGGIVGHGENGGVRIEYCSNEGSITNVGSTASKAALGGIVGGLSAGSISNSYNTGNIVATKEKVGGIVGIAKSSSTVTNCYNEGEILGTDSNKLGGIAGDFYGGSVLKDCYNIASINTVASTNPEDASYVGGVIGKMDDAELYRSYNTGEITSNYESNIAGVAGRADNSLIKDCYNTGNVTNTNESYSYHTGGVVGEMRYSVLESSRNSGKIMGYTYVGGIVGAVWADSNNPADTRIVDCVNTGDICATRPLKEGATPDEDFSVVGGIVGNMHGGLMTNCSNEGKITGIATVGGIVGTASSNWSGSETDSTILYCYNSGEVSGMRDVGGIVGRGGSMATISYCYNLGKVVGTDCRIGGIIGLNYSATTHNLYNIGEVKGGTWGVGAIFGTVGTQVRVLGKNYYLQGSATDANGLPMNGLGYTDSYRPPEENAAIADSNSYAAVTQTDVTGGKLTTLLGATDSPETHWGQKLGVDTHPVIGGDRVYALKDGTYSNTYLSGETSGVVIILSQDEYTYDGTEKQPDVTVEVDGVALGATDFTVTYSNNINAGTAKVTVTYAVSSGSGEQTEIVTFTILPKEIILGETAGFEWIWDNNVFDYTGQEIRPKFDMLYYYDNNIEVDILEEEYSITYTNNINAGELSATLTLVDEEGGNFIIGGSMMFSIEKTNPDYTLPTGVCGLVGQSLSEIVLPSGWTWKDGTLTISAEQYTFTAVYTPDDVENYNIVEQEITFDHVYSDSYTALNDVHYRSCVLEECMVVSALEIHTPDDDDEDCTTEVTCLLCGAVTTEAATAHTGGTATCQVKAECEICGKEYGDFAQHSAQTEWQNDDTHHWHECTGCEDQELDKAAHNDGNSDGSCDACGYTMTVTPPPHTHAHGTTWVTDANEHWNECACGDKANKAAHADSDNNGKCDTCDYTMSVTPPPHTHAHGSTWVTDANEHWNECECGDKANKAAHVDGDNNGKCDTCDYTMSTGTVEPGDPDHQPPVDNPPTDDNDGLGTGAIIGIVLGSVAVVGGGGFALFWFVIRKKRR